VLYVHGGAFIKGSLESGDTIAWGVADQEGAVVVSIDYRLAPEHPFPGVLEDCHAALSHIAAHAGFTGPGAAAEFARPCAFLRRHLGL
jgi:acetyl esterase